MTPERAFVQGFGFGLLAVLLLVLLVGPWVVASRWQCG